MEEFDYSGNELDVFATATNWKKYWSREIRQFIGENVLEIGAGIGSTFKALADTPFKRWFAVEPDEKLCSRIAHEKSLGNISDKYEVVCGTSRSIDDEGGFDTVLYIDVLEHIEDDMTELALVKEHLVRGGRIIILAPAHNYLFSEFDKKIGHYRRYNRAMIRSIVPDGLRVEKLVYLDSIGFLASLANRILLRSDNPSFGQIKLWDRFLVRMSLIADKILFHQFGKTILCVLRKAEM